MLEIFLLWGFHKKGIKHGMEAWARLKTCFYLDKWPFGSNFGFTEKYNHQPSIQSRQFARTVNPHNQDSITAWFFTLHHSFSSWMYKSHHNSRTLLEKVKQSILQMYVLVYDYRYDYKYIHVLLYPSWVVTHFIQMQYWYCSIAEPSIHSVVGWDFAT